MFHLFTVQNSYTILKCHVYQTLLSFVFRSVLGLYIPSWIYLCFKYKNMLFHYWRAFNMYQYRAISIFRVSPGGDPESTDDLICLPPSCCMCFTGSSSNVQPAWHHQCTGPASCPVTSKVSKKKKKKKHVLLSSSSLYLHQEICCYILCWLS